RRPAPPRDPAAHGALRARRRRGRARGADHAAGVRGAAPERRAPRRAARRRPGLGLARPGGGRRAQEPRRATPRARRRGATPGERSRTHPVLGEAMAFDLTALLGFAHDEGASDLHISAGLPPMLRIRGEMVRLEMPPLSRDDAHVAIYDILQDDQKRIFEEHRDIDFAFEIPGLSRFRANVLMQNRGEAAVFRLVPTKIRTLEELGMPGVLKTLSEKERGLVVVTGPTGSGKSTTLAAMLTDVNETLRGHIITVEDPIEFVHESKRCLVNQREVGPHTRSFAAALRAS